MCGVNHSHSGLLIDAHHGTIAIAVAENILGAVP
jgi:hypothetical protein